MSKDVFHLLEDSDVEVMGEVWVADHDAEEADDMGDAEVEPHVSRINMPKIKKLLQNMGQLKMAKDA